MEYEDFAHWKHDDKAENDFHRIRPIAIFFLALTIISVGAMLVSGGASTGRPLVLAAIGGFVISICGLAFLGLRNQRRMPSCSKCGKKMHQEILKRGKDKLAKYEKSTVVIEGKSGWLYIYNEDGTENRAMLLAEKRFTCTNCKSYMVADQFHLIPLGMSLDDIQAHDKLCENVAETLRKYKEVNAPQEALANLHHQQHDQPRLVRAVRNVYRFGSKSRKPLIGDQYVRTKHPDAVLSNGSSASDSRVKPANRVMSFLRYRETVVPVARKWQTIRVLLGVFLFFGFVLYFLTHVPYQSDGYRLPSPDNRHSAKVIFVSKTPTISKHEQHYEVAVYRGGNPETPFGWLLFWSFSRPYFRKAIPPSAVGQGFTLTRDAINWDMKQGIVTFLLGKTNMTVNLK